MAYLGNGIYDLLDVIKASKDPSIAYEGLYQDPRRDDTTYYGGDLKTYPYGMTDASGAQALISSAFPQEYGVGSLFDPRVGRPEQSIYYKYQPDFINAPQDDYASLYSTQPDFINAPQDDYASLYSLPELDTSRFKGMDLESGYLDRAGSYGQDVYAEQQDQGPEKKGIAKLMEVLGNIPTPLNLLRKAFEGVGPGFIGPKGSRAYGDESLFSTFGRSRTGAEFFQNMRDRKARDEAAKRGAIKQQELARQTALQQMRSDDSYGGGGADRPGGFGSGAGSFRESDPTGTEGSF